MEALKRLAGRSLRDIQAIERHAMEGRELAVQAYRVGGGGGGVVYYMVGG